MAHLLHRYYYQVVLLELLVTGSKHSNRLYNVFLTGGFSEVHIETFINQLKLGVRSSLSLFFSMPI